MKRNKIIVFLACLFLVFDSIILGFFSYLRNNINLDLAGYLYTFAGNTTGTGSDVFKTALKHLVPYIVASLIAVLLILCFYNIVCKKTSLTLSLKDKKNQKTININGINLIFISLLLMSVSYIVLTIIAIDRTYLVTEYFQRKKQNTTIYEDYYVFPDTDNVTAENPNNLILIYLESMETSFMSKEDGGLLDYELLPNLIKLANENINFSADEKVGGFNAPMGTTWTMGALFASESGLPFMFPIDGNSVDSNTPFAEKVITMGDILAQNNYNLEFLCGSDASFAGRDAFYKTHGNFEIFDYYTAVDNGYTDEYIWWGLEDQLLYEIAKDELQRLSSQDQPFCLTMLTVDTHHVGGYICDLCEDEYDNQYANVVACADRQIYAFVEWIKQQDFYDNTTIVIIGDHPTMDSTLISSDLDHSERTEKRKNSSLDSLSNRYVYNCFINSKATTDNYKNRQLNTLDIFPTILASIGFEIDGDRLGMGTNLFSNTKTIQEETSYQYLNDEFSKYSQYCKEHFY